MGRLYNRLKSQTTDRDSAQLALSRFLVSSEFQDSLPYIERRNTCYLDDNDYKAEYGYEIEAAKKEKRADPANYDEEEYEYIVGRRERDTAEFTQELAAFYKKAKRVLTDLQTFADEWGILFDAKFAAQTAFMFHQAHTGWDSSGC